MAGKLNLGAGNRPMAGFINHDRTRHREEIEIAWDLNSLPWPWEDEQFGEVRAMSVLEHLDVDLLTSANECWRILLPDGVLTVRVPYWRHETCWRDPTHRRGYTLETFYLFDDTTEVGAGYSFYMPFKWELLSCEYVYLGGDLTSIASSVEARLRKVKSEETLAH